VGRVAIISSFFSFFIFGVLRLMISKIRSSVSLSSSLVSSAVLSCLLVLGAAALIVRRALPENKELPDKFR
jgi:TM2 domain-containing membrane protein YozV